MKTNNLKYKGFTVVELMIATTVFSFILLLCTFGIIQIGRNYYKGSTIVRTQNVTRSILDDISNSIEYGGDEPNPQSFAGNSGCFTIGRKIYFYNLNNIPTSSAAVTGAGLRMYRSGDCTNPVGSFQELLGRNMRLARFNLNYSDSTYAVKIKVMYGESDLIVDNNNDNASVSTNYDQFHCKTTEGSQFCASSELETTVTRKVE